MNGDGNDNCWLSSWEEECLRSIQEQPDYEQSLNVESDTALRKVWSAFQDSATAVAQLYRDRFTGEPTAIWVQFQTAAGTVTSLYRESCENLKRTIELGKQSGYQKRNKELLNWAKRKRRQIRREDLITYLSGKPPPPPRQNHFHHHHTHRLSPRPRNMSPPPGASAPESLMIDPNLHTFREAISCRTREHDLYAFITGEMARHCKRPASPSDVTMGSPTLPKRPRY